MPSRLIKAKDVVHARRTALVDTGLTLLPQQEGQRAGPGWHEDAAGSEDLIITVGAHATGRGDSFTFRVCACIQRVCVRVLVHVRTCTRTRSLHECVCSARAVCARARACTCVCAYMLYIDDAHRHTQGRLRQIKSCCRCCLGLVINVSGSSSLPQRQPNLNSTAEKRVGPVGLSSAL